MEKVYAYKNTEENLQKSSSGGAFLGIAKAFYDIYPNGIVYGSQFDEDFHVKHSRAYTYSECTKFCGSKYVQSSIGSVFSEIAGYLNEERFVLFTGTPCQVGALLLFIENKKIKKDCLYTLDIVCHGTPNNKFWNEYVRHLENKEHAKLTFYSFRYKPLGWKGYPIYASFDNGTIKKNTIEVSSYQNIYRKNLITQKGCFNCKYPGNFVSDFTICDFWGVETVCPSISSKGGVSLIISRSGRNDNIIELLKKGNTLFEELLNKSYINYNHNLQYKTHMPSNYNKFWQDYNNMGIEYVLKKYGGESIIGRMKFYFKRFIRDVGLLDLAKRILHKP